MSTGLTTTAGHATALNQPTGALDRLRAAFPFVPVVLPWLVARLIAVPALVLSRDPGVVEPGRLIWMDGQWFRLIAVDWYDRPYTDGLWSEYPFFPLLPALAGLLIKLGLGPTTALTGISWLAALVAMAGVYRLARRHLPPHAAPWATWFVAIGPGAITMVLGYADSLFLAGTVWALVLVEDRRWWAAGLVAAVATASRPNGAIAVVAVVVTVVSMRAGWRAIAATVVPSLAVLAAWCAWLWWATGDPLVFWSSKAAWDEITLAELVADPFIDRHRGALAHLIVLVVLAVPYLLRVRRQPLAWAVLTALFVLPPLLLGTEGLARYAILAFPIPFAAADVFTSRRRWPAVTYLGVAAVAMFGLGVLVARWNWIP